MKIWHVGSSFSPQKVCGVNNSVWLLATYQARLGYDVSVVVDPAPDRAARELADREGFEVIHLPSDRWRYHPAVLKPILRDRPPQIVHMHSVFVPKQAALARQLVRCGIPYIVSPRGGLDFRRSRVRKLAYSALIEKPRFRAAAAITLLMPKEEEAVRAFVPGYQKPVRCLLNPIEPNHREGDRWQGNPQTKRVVFLGRFDVVHKGIDILVEIARHLEDVEFHLYGNKEPKSKQVLEELQRNLPPNVYFHEPVFGDAKNEVLTQASLYVQASRWEGFGRSIAEAMYLGVPCAVSETINFADTFRDKDLGLVFPPDPKAAAELIDKAIARRDILQDWSDRGREFACANFQPQAVAAGFLKLYEEVARV
ncbi:MAG: glycosyltransferase family 4 protein [Cyanobacteriota bacterium]|nr:glycosyltransferase family 4 protein [Cyanobacteriota bacterium]